MTKGRLEAFSDGVLAVIITIMVLELKVPEGSDWVSLKPLIAKFLAYIFSFIYIGIYWNNHHHLFQAVKKVNGNILWANLHLLFWLSLMPSATEWIGATHFAKNPVTIYGFGLIMCAIAYTILENLILKNEGENSTLKEAIHSKFKEYISIVFYILGIVTSFFYPYIAIGFYYIVALIWLIPDKRIEKLLKEN
ncbi:TMEM175 family protein [Chryseobacterium chendengshani]|uniref:TMEM175 family protein n=1 Tax=unclassified Chryseobacterium TaxID=2593645 RepID=UPI001C63CCD5|nr:MULTISPECIES: TMEM175 family protein [unclassified Chryseobacterium]MBW7676262.1 TMEM175 family protein [Chryseobacterium sp. LJ756]MBW8524129.1 TMEM175 family protein [Chryseobacterium sp. LJ668]QYK17063.1 TMEM175 family protein [Chryseobacterium sp. LJ668]